MKKLTTLALLAVLFSGNTYADDKHSVNICTKFSSYYDEMGIKLQCDLHLFVQDNQVGIKNTKGDVLLPAQYDDIHIAHFVDKQKSVMLPFVLLEKDVKKGMADMNGKLIFEPIYQDIGLNKKRQSYPYIHIVKNNKMGLAKLTGEIIIQPTYYSLVWANIFDDNNEPLFIATNKGKLGLINIKNEPVVPMIYDDILNYGFRDGLLLVQKNGKYGYIDKTGKVVIDTIYDDANSFEQGVAIIQKDNQYAVIDNAGKFIVPFGKYDKIDSYVNHIGLIEVSHHQKVGLIDTKGKIITPIQYDNFAISNFADLSKGVVAKKSGKYGLINAKTNQILIDFIYDDIGDYSDENGYRTIKQNDKYGYINATGKVVVPMIYDQVGLYKGALSPVQKGDKWGFVDREGKVVLDFEYDHVIPAVSPNFRVVKDNKEFFIDPTGKMIEE